MAPIMNKIKWTLDECNYDSEIDSEILIRLLEKYYANNINMFHTNYR